MCKLSCGKVGDIERISSRIALKSARPRDLLVLRNTLAALPDLQRCLNVVDAPQLLELLIRIGEQPALLKLLVRRLLTIPLC